MATKTVLRSFAPLLLTTLLSSTALAGPVTLKDATLHGNEVIKTPIGEITLTDTYFDAATSKRLFDEMDYQRAAQAYIWSLPLVSSQTWRDTQDAAFGVDSPTDFVVLETVREKSGILTPNLTTPYIFNFSNLKDGALEIYYPPGQTASGILDFWQRPITDLGLTGPDQGKGATYIVVGPQDDPAKYQKDGVYVVQSATNNIFIGVRILSEEPGYFDTFTSEFRMGPAGGEMKPSRFIKGKDVKWLATPPNGLDYWKTLSEVIQDEPVREIDKAWMALIEPLGIAKGKEFKPDERLTGILLKGGAMGELMARNLQVYPRYTEPYWPGTNWFKSVDFVIPQETADIQQIDQRATWFYEAVATSKGMVDPEVGSGQVYMTTKHDKDGNTVRGDRTYKLHVPANVPVEQFWSLTLYSEDTRTTYDNGGTEPRDASIDSRMKGLNFNTDGSIDIIIGPEAPADKNANYLKSVPGEGWFVYFRLYAPKKEFFDKSFTLSDFEVAK
ncbi:protein of unknown function DUF1214 [Xanthobacter versatilis]|uniref:DUF1254 domain-containing protein n=1 Tax=Xanthobacter autotrophicus (strain ATCC BAA-1158 / Py2) TaxID=78245 RepID=A7ICV6_XANP2|nr:protein of unknown function DUF1214 [Xanthobacter autotrophicus Py2]